MTLNILYATAFSTGDIKQIPLPYRTNDASIVSDIVLPGNAYSLKLDPAGYYDKGWVACPVDAGTTDIYVAAWVYPFYTDANNIILRFTDDKYIAVRWSYSVWKAFFNGTLVATGTGTVPSPNAWQHIQVHFVLNNVNGKIQTRLNGNPDINYTGDTIPAVSTVKQVELYNGFYDCQVRWTNWVVATGEWPGDIRVVRHTVAGDTEIADFTPSVGTTLYGCIDELLPSDVDYVYTDAAGNKFLCTVEGKVYTDYDSILGVRVWLRVWEDPVTGEHVSIPIRTGGSISDGTPQDVAGAAGYIDRWMATNPVTAEPWTAGEVNALQVGAKAES